MIPYAIVVLCLVILLLGLLSMHQDVTLSECKNNAMLVGISTIQFVSIVATIYFLQSPDVKTLLFVLFLQMISLCLLWMRGRLIDDHTTPTKIGSPNAEHNVHLLMLALNFIVIALCVRDLVAAMGRSIEDLFVHSSATHDRMVQLGNHFRLAVDSAHSIRDLLVGRVILSPIRKTEFVERMEQGKKDAVELFRNEKLKEDEYLKSMYLFDKVIAELEGPSTLQTLTSAALTAGKTALDTGHKIIHSDAFQTSMNTGKKFTSHLASAGWQAGKQIGSTLLSKTGSAASAMSGAGWHAGKQIGSTLLNKSASAASAMGDAMWNAASYGASSAKDWWTSPPASSVASSVPSSPPKIPSPPPSSSAAIAADSTGPVIDYSDGNTTNPHCALQVTKGEIGCKRIDATGSNHPDCIRFENGQCRIKKDAKSAHSASVQVRQSSRLQSKK